MTLRFQLADEGRRLNVSFLPQFRLAPKHVLLHVPPLPGLRSVTINDHPYEAKPGEMINIEVPR